MLEHGIYNRLCGETTLIYERYPDGEPGYIRRVFAVYIYTSPEERSLTYLALVHEYLHRLFVAIVEAKGLNFRLVRGGEAWVEARTPGVECPEF